MPWFAGPYIVAAVLLVVAGAPKIRRPEPAIRALRSLRLPAPAPLVRLLGAAEVAIGVAAALSASRIVAALVAASYAGFSCLVVLALLRGGVLASCGCFGTADTPPTRSHLVVTATLAAVALAAAARPVGGLRAAFAGPLAGVPFLALAGIGVWFTYLVLAVLPRSGGRAMAARQT